MTGLAYSSRAEDVFTGISLYGQEHSGVMQADRYVEQVKGSLIPRPGQNLRPKGSGLLRFEEAGHVIFYRLRGDAIVIGRILQKSADPAWHVIYS